MGTTSVNATRFKQLALLYTYVLRRCVQRGSLAHAFEAPTMQVVCLAAGGAVTRVEFKMAMNYAFIHHTSICSRHVWDTALDALFEAFGGCNTKGIDAREFSVAVLNLSLPLDMEPETVVKAWWRAYRGDVTPGGLLEEDMIAMLCALCTTTDEARAVVDVLGSAIEHLRNFDPRIHSHAVTRSPHYSVTNDSCNAYEAVRSISTTGCAFTPSLLTATRVESPREAICNALDVTITPVSILNTSAENSVCRASLAPQRFDRYAVFDTILAAADSDVVAIGVVARRLPIHADISELCTRYAHDSKNNRPVVLQLRFTTMMIERLFRLAPTLAGVLQRMRLLRTHPLLRNQFKSVSSTPVSICDVIAVTPSLTSECETRAIEWRQRHLRRAAFTSWVAWARDGRNLAARITSLRAQRYVVTCIPVKFSLCIQRTTIP